VLHSNTIFYSIRVYFKFTDVGEGNRHVKLRDAKWNR